MDRIKIYKFLKKHITPDTMRVIILFIPLLIILVGQVKKGEFRVEEFFDTSILTTFVFIILCNIFVIILQNWIGRKSEDSIKLTEKYSELSEKYPREDLLIYKGVKFPTIVLSHRKQKDPEYIFDFDASNKNKNYVLPMQIAEHSDHIMKAHDHSYLFNQMCLRLDDFKEDNNRITLRYSKTYYFDSLVTNRAMDYQWENGKTIREIYEPGPFIRKLSESKFSNHLGFNGFVETSDHKIIFVKRNNNLSIWKNTLASSIGASLKVRYCLDNNENLTVSGLRLAIINEIEHELRLELKDEKLENGIFSFYLDLVEGGKPQFLFYYRLENMTSIEFEQNFKSSGNIKSDKRKAVIDGSQFFFLSWEELEKSDITPGKLSVPNRKAFKMASSFSSSVVLLLKYHGIDK